MINNFETVILNKWKKNPIIIQLNLAIDLFHWSLCSLESHLRQNELHVADGSMTIGDVDWRGKCRQFDIVWRCVDNQNCQCTKNAVIGNSNETQVKHSSFMFSCITHTHNLIVRKPPHTHSQSREDNHHRRRRRRRLWPGDGGVMLP